VSFGILYHRGLDNEKNGECMPRGKTIKADSDTDLTYRITYRQLVEFIDKFRYQNELKNGELKDLTYLTERKKTWAILGYVELQSNGCTLTGLGRNFLTTTPEMRKELFRESLLENESFRHLWAKICDSRDRFTPSEIAPIIRKDLNVKTTKQAKIYAQRLSNWAKNVGLSVMKFKGTYDILERSVVGKSSKNGDEHQTSLIEQTKEYQSSLYLLNAHISDFLSDKDHEVDLILIEGLLEEIRKEDIWDDIAIDMLEREIRYAMDVKKPSAFKMVGRSLRDIRKRYLEALEVNGGE